MVVSGSRYSKRFNCIPVKRAELLGENPEEFNGKSKETDGIYEESVVHMS